MVSDLLIIVTDLIDSLISSQKVFTLRIAVVKQYLLFPPSKKLHLCEDQPLFLTSPFGNLQGMQLNFLRLPRQPALFLIKLETE